MRTDRLTRRYGKRLVVDAVDLTVERGEVYGFLAPAGLQTATWPAASAAAPTTARTAF